MSDSIQERSTSFIGQILTVNKSVQPDDPVDSLRGIGPARARDLANIGAGDVAGLLRLYPRDYIHPSEERCIADAAAGETSVFKGELKSVRLLRRGWGKSVVEGRVEDGTGEIRVLWFRAPYLAKTLKPGIALMMKGRPGGAPLTLMHPSFEVIRPGEESDFSRIIPRYPRVQGLPQRSLRRAIREALTAAPLILEPLPEAVRRRAEVAPLADCLAAIHDPDDENAIAMATRRFLFEELFVMQLEFARLRATRMHQETKHRCHAGKKGILLNQFVDSLPFTLTRDQTRVIGEIRKDLDSGRVMERLLLGDVGSGKTVIAGAAIVHAVERGGQAALLVPTEVLARQHHRSLTELFKPVSLGIELLVSDMPAAEKGRIRNAVAGGEAAIVVGTHALLQESVTFRRLALAVVDEQHRFGVKQRSLLPGKGEGTHFLHLSATPIPRSLALTLYGDLDISVLKEMPPGRLPVTTRHVSGKERQKAYSFLRERIMAGEQGFVLFPLVEESEKIDLKAAIVAEEKLADGFFKGHRVGLLHGRLPLAERLATLEAFRGGNLDLLVCTTVVEVGVDLPMATVMIVEDADRFGLSQLHQIRGRVGRSNLPSSCFLVTRGKLTDDAVRRLATLEKESNGFRVAEEDLAIRGPGELLGLRQHGHSGMDGSRLLGHPELLELARSEAAAAVDGEPLPVRPIQSG